MRGGDEIFSIIMPCFNAESYISSSILSVIEQTYTHWHLYVIDDCSTDRTGEIVRDFVSADSRIQYIRLPQNGGVALARNAGIQAANGKYIAFLDSDDLWSKQKLEYQFNVLESGHDIVCCNYRTFSGEINNVLSERVFSESFDYQDMLFGNKIGNLTGVYNQVSLGKVYQERKGHEDYIMWLELIKRARSAYCIQDVLAYYRVTGGSLSGNKLRASRWQWNIYRYHLGFSLLKSSQYWIGYVFNALKR